MDYRQHYAFALGYVNGLEGTGKCPVKLDAELRHFFKVGYEQGAADDLFGEPNEGILAG